MSDLTTLRTATNENIWVPPTTAPYIHIHEAKVVIWMCYGPQKLSKYRLDTIQTTFGEENNHLGTILVKIIFFHT